MENMKKRPGAVGIGLGVESAGCKILRRGHGSDDQRHKGVLAHRPGKPEKGVNKDAHQHEDLELEHKDGRGLRKRDFAHQLGGLFWRDAGRYGSGSFTPGFGGALDIGGKPTGMADPRLATWVKADPAARAFLFWARMPVAESVGDAIVLRDQRYMQALARDRFTVRVKAPDTASYPE